jgi:hypothetical protein
MTIAMLRRQLARRADGCNQVGVFGAAGPFRPTIYAALAATRNAKSPNLLKPSRCVRTVPRREKA